MAIRKLASPRAFVPRPPPGRLPIVNPVLVVHDNTEALNEKRRKTYAERDEARENLQERSRDRYRKQKGMELDSCLPSLNFYENLALPQRVILPQSGKVRTVPAMGLQSLADCLQKTYQTVWRWKDRGMIPGPVLACEARKILVYHAAEVRVLIEVIGNHEQGMAYYRANHHQTRELLFSRIETLRNSWETM